MTLGILHSISYFSPAAQTWVPATTHTTQQPVVAQSSATANPLEHRFDLVTWNIDYSSVQPSRRCLALLKHVLDGGAPDILCLQEVTPVVRAAILGSAEIRATFLATDAGPEAQYRIFENMTLLSRKRFACGQDD
ncbi:hypothetical protein MAPG_01434 [Magnaporthiopsis poae ATCC 64411]|uniref:Endonuclease/exonuclease/phosphatase domain-containing protein n=1 Tax=Magnaporthiopsis poae (strain ATCC 64411 / 73-15) TaxID=644358 RepID=A0A0C4DNP0_MAGP6|nr:hypothetical protein MAPG_01434 [Magnaporthiopsis poae ATCC 64411]